MVTIVTRAGKGSPLTNTELDANFNNLNAAIIAGGVNGYLRTSFNATAGQTSFTFTYTPPYVLVWVNGVLLSAADYTATSGTAVVLATACVVGDVVELVALSSGGGGGTGTVTSVAPLQFTTTGTDVSSSVASPSTTPVITLNLPTASATNRGALSSTDWTTFNSKQALLVSGTNIKTLFGTTILGSGDAGLVPVAYGGTGLSAPGASGNVLTSNGTVWVSSAPSAGAVTSVAGRTGAVVLTSADSSYTGSGSGATALTVQSKLNQVVNVKDYGATGDGTTNDTTAIQNAINASGGIIYFPAGTYSVTALTLASGKQLVGENRETSILKLRSAMTIGNGMVNGTSLTSIAIRNLTFDGNLLVSDVVALINLFACNGAVIESNNFINTDRFAIGCNSMSRWVARDNKFIMPQHVGLWIDGIPTPANVTPTATVYNGVVSAPTGSNPIQAAFTYRLNSGGQIIPSTVLFSHNGAGYLTVPTVSFPSALSPLSSSVSNSAIIGTVAVSGTSGQFTCGASKLAVNDPVTITGTLSGTGNISGYVSGTVYKVSAITGTSPNVTGFTLQTPAGGAIVTTVGTLTGLTYTTTLNLHIGGSQVVAITASNSSTTGDNVEISHNYFEGGGTNLALQRSSIFGNVGRNIIYGAAFVEHADNNTGQNRFYNNTSWYGGYCTLAGATYSNTFIGPDTDNTVTTGFELWGILTSAENNYAYYNAGVGISFGCRNGLCSNNTCYDNGQYWASIGNYNTYGIQLPQGNAGATPTPGFNHGSYAVVQGNRCFDQNGASGKQAYGIGIEGSLVVAAKIVDNDASGNRTSDYNMNGATPSVLRDILSTGGGGGTVTGVTATAPVVSSGGTAPVISMAAATTSVNGYLTSTDWTTFNNKASAGANSTITSLSGLTTALSASQGGTGLTAPGALNNVLTSNGAGAWVSQAPSGGGAVASFSAGTTGLTPSTATTGAVTLAGTLAVANGGTGQTTYTNGQLLIGNTTGGTLAKATLTQGAGISITNGAGSITIASTATGTVTGVTGTAPIVSSGGTAPVISISAATTSAAGSMSATDKTKLDTLSNGAVITNSTAFAGATISSGGIGAQAASVVAGAVLGDYVEASFSFSIGLCTYSAQVTGANAAQVVWSNNSGSPIVLPSGTVYFRVTKR